MHSQPREKERERYEEEEGGWEKRKRGKGERREREKKVTRQLQYRVIIIWGDQHRGLREHLGGA